MIRIRSKAPSTLAEARYAKLSVGVCKVIRGALVFALLASFVFRALLANVLVETVASALLATGVALAADGLPC